MAVTKEDIEKLQKISSDLLKLAGRQTGASSRDRLLIDAARNIISAVINCEGNDRMEIGPATGRGPTAASAFSQLEDALKNIASLGGEVKRIFYRI